MIIIKFIYVKLIKILFLLFNLQELIIITTYKKKINLQKKIRSIYLSIY